MAEGRRVGGREVVRRLERESHVARARAPPRRRPGAIPGTCSGARTSAGRRHRDRRSWRARPAGSGASVASRSAAGRSGPSVSCSRSSRPVIRKPEMTKKMSTPANPPRIPGRPTWYQSTASTATARRPSTWGRNARSGAAAVWPASEMEEILWGTPRVTRPAFVHRPARRMRRAGDRPVTPRLCRNVVAAPSATLPRAVSHRPAESTVTAGRHDRRMQTAANSVWSTSAAAPASSVRRPRGRPPTPGCARRQSGTGRLGRCRPAVRSRAWMDRAGRPRWGLADPAG